MQCTSCGATVEAGASFCHECGIADPLQPLVLPSEWLEVVVKDVDMPFVSMVRFMVKWAVASIPATLIILAIVLTIAFWVALLFFRFVTGT